MVKIGIQKVHFLHSLLLLFFLNIKENFRKMQKNVNLIHKVENIYVCQKDHNKGMF